MVDALSPSGLKAVRPVSQLARSVAVKSGEPLVQGHTVSQLLALATELSSQEPPIDYARIAQIRQAVASGTYSVSPDRIADAMLNFGRHVASS